MLSSGIIAEMFVFLRSFAKVSLFTKSKSASYVSSFFCLFHKFVRQLCQIMGLRINLLFPSAY